MATNISAADAIEANLDAADECVSSGAIFQRLAVGKLITIDLIGVGATAADLIVTIEYEACVDGGYLV